MAKIVIIPSLTTVVQASILSSRQTHRQTYTQTHRQTHRQTYRYIFDLILQDIPFIALAGVYLTTRGPPTIAACSSLTISLINTISFLWMWLSGCGQLMEYFSWLQLEVKGLVCCRKESYPLPAHPPPPSKETSEVPRMNGQTTLSEGNGIAQVGVRSPSLPLSFSLLFPFAGTAPLRVPCLPQSCGTPSH